MIGRKGLAPMLVFVCMALVAGLLFPLGQAQAAGPNWKVREAMGKKEGFLGSGTTLNLKQFFPTGGAINVYFWEISKSHPLKHKIHCPTTEYEGETITGGSPGLIKIEKLTFAKCEDLTFSGCFPFISGKKISGELVYFNGGAGVEILLNKSNSKEPLILEVFYEGAECPLSEMEETITGKSTWQASLYKIFGEQMLFQSCNTSMCLYNENGTGTVREAKLFSKLLGNLEVTLESEDRVVLAANAENFKELAIE